MFNNVLKWENMHKKWDKIHILLIKTLLQFCQIKNILIFVLCKFSSALKMTKQIQRSFFKQI